MTDNSGQAPAGWYPDTTRPGTERWWDGLAWTEHTRLTAAAPPPPPPAARPGPGAAGSPFEPQPDFLAGPPTAELPGRRGGSTGLVIGIVAAAAILLAGCVAVLASGVNSVNQELADFASTIDEFETDPADSIDPADDATFEDLLGDSDGDGGDGLGDVVSCERIDSQTIVIEMVNNTGETSSYVLTIGFFDDAGTRLADEPMFLNYLRPGERAIEEQFTFDEQGTVCEVLAVDRFAAESVAEDMAQVSACEVANSPDALGSIEASLSVTNDSSETSDFAVDVVFVDSDGIRRGSGATYIQAVRSGETAPGDVFTILDHDDGYSCEVVAVTRLAS